MENPLHVIPARARAAVYVIALIVGVVVPIILPDSHGVWERVLQSVAAVAALFSSSQGLSNLMPDEDNPAIQAREIRKGNLEKSE